MTLEFFNKHSNSFFSGKKIILSKSVNNYDSSRCIPSGVEVEILQKVGRHFNGFDVKYKKVKMSIRDLRKHKIL